MSVTQWVIEMYTKEEQDLNLESAKNFSFVWSLFEHMSKGAIFQGDNLPASEFLAWINSLQIQYENGNLTIINTEARKDISGDLVSNIYKSFNHFYQKYENDSEGFIELLYAQSITPVIKEKERFIAFMQVCDKSKMQDKIYFLFFIAKRMRNKFFHGIKSIGEVSRDHKEFERISEYLISIISLFEDYH
ncbi:MULTISPECIES: hypothetical protein [Paenibacillus]|uniref:Apea-like HEPN domain-containing protein n=1 Tax=Paenibacillus vandeheii TaxID=3035917 RepID=A0ABT8J6F1_9BACL|nr:MULTISPECIES: hypothetical protein [Paenibacillus]MDN4600669.1 hypothetical protein [Paenibacillus vandeheii]PRA08669.1 hypothetical protein CQ043_01415 [Paenibacillus sp. MYb63]PRA48602.1 hypothetical protein CQ061_09870 [Paenibacillus sp. MYb67]